MMLEGGCADWVCFYSDCCRRRDGVRRCVCGPIKVGVKKKC